MQAGFETVLWVDDDARTFLSPLLRTLTKSGIHLDVAVTFEEAERLLRANSYAAVLIDIILPYADAGVLSHNLGLKLASRLREGYYRNLETSSGTNPDIPLVVLSVVRRDEIADDLTRLKVEYFDKTMLLESNVLERLIGALSSSNRNKN